MMIAESFGKKRMASYASKYKAMTEKAWGWLSRPLCERDLRKSWASV